MQKQKDGFAHILVILLALIALSVIGFAGYYVLKNKTSVMEGGYKWSTMKQGPYNDKVMYVTSSDLFNWKGTGTLLEEHASVPDVMVRDNILFVYFVDVSQDGKPEQIGIRTSTDDGMTWSEKKFAEFKGIGKMVPVDPAPILLEDGRVRMYFYDIGRAGTKQIKHTIYSAISDDGYTFTLEEDSGFSYENIYDPDVIRTIDGWRMYVGTGDQKVLSATSTDGIRFTYEGIAYEGGAIPNVIFDNEEYVLYTGGIQIATSRDGKQFTKTSHTFNAGGVTADPGVIKLKNDSYFMAFKTSSNTALDPPTASSGTNNPTTPVSETDTSAQIHSSPQTTSPSNQQLDPVDPSLPQQPPSQ